MAITQIKSQYLSFTQPEIGSIVSVKIGAAIDWIFVGGQAFIHNAGLYNVLSKSGQTFELELVIPLKLPGSVINRGFIAPVLYSSDGIPQTEETLYLVNEYEFLGLDDEDTQADFNQRIIEKLFGNEQDDGEFMTKNSENHVTSNWKALYHNGQPMLENMQLRFIDKDTFTINKQSSFNLGSSLRFKTNSGKFNIEHWEYDLFLQEYVKRGEFIKSINGLTTFDNGNFDIDDSVPTIVDDYEELSLVGGDTQQDFNQAIASAVSVIGSAVQEGIKTPTPLDCSGNPNYPASEKGDSYKVTVSGKIGGASGLNVEVSDMIVCTEANEGGTQASVGLKFFILQTNLDQATETTTGFAKIATQTKVDEGTNDTDFVTPKKLKKKLEEIDNIIDMYILATSFADDIEEESTAIEFAVPYDMLLVGTPVAFVTEEPTGDDIRVSLGVNGTFIGSTNPFLIVSENSKFSTNEHDIKDTELSKGDIITIFVNQVGSTNAGKGLSVNFPHRKVTTPLIV